MRFPRIWQLCVSIQGLLGILVPEEASIASTSTQLVSHNLLLELTLIALPHPHVTYSQKFSALLVQGWHHLTEVLSGPSWKAGLVVRHGCDTRPHSLIWSAQCAEDAEQLVNF